MRIRSAISVLLVAVAVAFHAAPVVSALLPAEKCSCGCKQSEGSCCCRRSGSLSSGPRLSAQPRCAGDCASHAVPLLQLRWTGALVARTDYGRVANVAAQLIRPQDQIAASSAYPAALYQRPPPPSA